MAAEFLLRQKGDTVNPTLATLFGKGSTRGIPCYRKLLSGSGDTAIWAYLSFLGQGSTYGWDGMDHVRCNGGLIEETVLGDLKWKFHPGTRSTGFGDTVQGLPHFFPELNDTFSGIAYIEGKMTAGVDDPSRMEFFVRGLKVMDYEMGPHGHLLELGASFKSGNNALASMHLLHEIGGMSLAELDAHGASWLAFRDACDEELSWTKTQAQPDHVPPIVEETIMVPRYTCHVPLSTSMDTTTAFELIMLRAPGAVWQYVDGGVKVFPSPDRAPIGDLVWDPMQVVRGSNIVKSSFSSSPTQKDLLPNFFIYQYNDIEDDAYQRKILFVDRAEARDEVDGNVISIGPIDLGLMYESLAQRIAKTQVRLLVDQPYTNGYELGGQIDSYVIAKGDNVNLVHKQLGRSLDNPVIARIVSESFLESRGERRFKVRMSTLDYYRDTDHSYKEGEGL